MKFSSKNFRNIATLMAIGAFGTACAPVSGTMPPASGQAAEGAASKSTSGFGHSAPVVAQQKDGTAYYPTSETTQARTRATLVPPKQVIPEYKTAAIAPDAGATGTPVKPQFGDAPVRGYQTGRSLSEERDSFDGVDVASATDSGSNDNDSAGGGGNSTSSDPSSGSGRSSGGGSGHTARSFR